MDTHNQAVKADAGKLRPTLVMPSLIWAVAAIRQYGTEKCTGPRSTGARWSRIDIKTPPIAIGWRTWAARSGT